ncbi:MAG: hypothetical protein R3E79_27785 [Caldilineaceae bacterium]
MFEQSLLMTHQHPSVNGHGKPMKIKDREKNLPRPPKSRRWADADTTARDATFGMVDEMVQHAIQDASQLTDPSLRWEALAWLRVCCPDIAEQLRLPWPEALDVSQKAAAYMDRYPAC